MGERNENRPTLEKLMKSCDATVNLNFIPQNCKSLFLKFCMCFPSPSAHLAAASTPAARPDEDSVTIQLQVKVLGFSILCLLHRCVTHPKFLRPARSSSCHLYWHSQHRTLPKGHSELFLPGPALVTLPGAEGQAGCIPTRLSLFSTGRSS